MATSYFFLKAIRRKRNKISIKSRVRENVKENLQTKSAHVLDMCRICLKDGSVPIFATDECAESDISEAVKTFGDIEINEDDGLPKLLCDSCYSLLQGAILFRKSAKDSDLALHRRILLPPADIQSEIVSKESSSDGFANGNEINTPSNFFKCKLCNLDFATFDEYVSHSNSKRHRNIRVQCPICYGLLTAQLYKKHLARHKSASHLVCDVCGKLYRKDNLVRHLQLHSFDLPYQCQICPYRGRFMESLKIHMRTHSGEKPFSCDKCELKFLTRSNLNRHLLTHNKIKPFKCVECIRGFYTQRDVDIHFKSDHAGNKDFSCCMCGNKYGTRKALMRHELRVHKRDKMAKGRMPLYLQVEFRK